MPELVDMASQFKGLPMADLIGGPLQAACDAQVKLARATADFIETVGFESKWGEADENGKRQLLPPEEVKTRNALFSFKRPVPIPNAKEGEPQVQDELVELNVPLLAILKVPNLGITTVDVTFDMEVKSSFKEASSDDFKAGMSADAQYNAGLFSVKVHLEGSVATHKENTRTSDNSAKYHVQVHAEDRGMPEGLARVLDIMQQSIAPTPVATVKKDRLALPAT